MSGSAVRGCCLPKRMMSRLRLKQSPAFSSSRWLSSSSWPGFPSQPLTTDSETAIFVTSPSRLKKRLFSLPRGANNLKLLELSKSQPSNISFTAVGLLWLGRRAARGIQKVLSFIQQPWRGMQHALWERPGSNPGPWVPKRSAMTTALHARWRAAFKFLSTHSSHGFAMGLGVSSLKWHQWQMAAMWGLIMIQVEIY
jgi:hypothetical protein